MKIRSKAILYFIFLLHVGFCRSQQNVVIIDNSFFDNHLHTLNLSKVNGWFFRPGHDTTWAAKDISTSGWKKMQPSEFSSISQQNGRAEGWFRISVQFDRDLVATPSGILSPIWAASEVFINGKLAATFGQTGNKENAYHEHMPYWQEPLGVQFKPEETYAIAVHIVDYVAS